MSIQGEKGHCETKGWVGEGTEGHHERAAGKGTWEIVAVTTTTTTEVQLLNLFQGTRRQFFIPKEWAKNWWQVQFEATCMLQALQPCRCVCSVCRQHLGENKQVPFLWYKIVWETSCYTFLNYFFLLFIVCNEFLSYRKAADIERLKQDLPKLSNRNVKTLWFSIYLPAIVLYHRSSEGLGMQFLVCRVTCSELKLVQVYELYRFCIWGMSFFLHLTGPTTIWADHIED